MNKNNENNSLVAGGGWEKETVTTKPKTELFYLLSLVWCVIDVIVFVKCLFLYFFEQLTLLEVLGSLDVYWLIALFTCFIHPVFIGLAVYYKDREIPKLKQV